jgi:hypothetical protein
VAIATAIAWPFKNIVLLPNYCASLTGARLWEFYPPLAAGAVGTFLIALAGRLATQFWWPTSWVELGGTAAAIGAIYVMVAYGIVFNHTDRTLLKGVIGLARL